MKLGEFSNILHLEHWKSIARDEFGVVSRTRKLLAKNENMHSIAETETCHLAYDEFKLRSR